MSATPAPARVLLRVGVFLAVPLLLYGAHEAWDAWLEPRFTDKRWGVVEAGLVYRSGQVSGVRVGGTLARHGIATIVDLTYPQPGDEDQRAELAAASARGIRHLRFPLLGNGIGRRDHYADAIAAVHRSVQAGAPVLVHCAAGTQRTGGVIALYRLLVQGRAPAAVFQEMQRFRWDPLDDSEMLVFLNRNMGDIAARLVLRGVLERVPDPLPVLGPARSRDLSATTLAALPRSEFAQPSAAAASRPGRTTMPSFGNGGARADRGGDRP